MWKNFRKHWFKNRCCEKFEKWMACKRTAGTSLLRRSFAVALPQQKGCGGRSHVFSLLKQEKMNFSHIWGDFRILLRCLWSFAHFGSSFSFRLWRSVWHKNDWTRYGWMHCQKNSKRISRSENFQMERKFQKKRNALSVMIINILKC